MNKSQRRITAFISITLLVIMGISLSQGSYHIDLKSVLNWAIYHLGIVGKRDYSVEQELVLSSIRLPRIITVMIVGFALAISGAVLQAIFKNPLVSPFILGISSGAALGVSLVVCFISVYSVFFIQFSAFLFGVGAVIIVIALSKLFVSRSTVALVLSGIIVSSFLAALVSLVQYFSEEQKLQSILFWTFGSFTNSTWKNISLIAPICLICSSFLILLAWKINALSLGDEEGRSLGIETRKFQLILLLFTSLLVSSVTASCGPIGWVGLIIPHIVRMLGGVNHRYVLVSSGLLGALFMLLVDLIARNIARVEIPVGIVTAIVGLPFFAFILNRSKSIQ